jgi:pilus assembly protein CpaE
MPKYKVLIAANNEELRLMIRQKLSNDDEIAIVGFTDMGPNLISKVKGYAPHAVLLAQDKDIPGIMEIAQGIYQGFPGCAVVLLTPIVDINLFHTAMQSGIRTVIKLEDIEKLKTSLVHAAQFEQCRTVENGRDPRVISIYGGKGGSGKTTVAVNLAVAFAQRSQRTALVDLCLNFGDASLFLNITAKDTIAELVQEKNTFTIDDIKSFSMQHSSGLSILCSPSVPEYAEYVTAAHVETLINQMRPYYDYIILDLPCDLSDCTLAALENSDDILIVSRPDISNLRAAKLAVGILRTLQQEDKVKLVLNADYESSLTHKDFERVLETPIFSVIPEDFKTARLSMQRGIPFITGSPKAPISVAVHRLMSQWTGIKKRGKK